ARQDADHDPDRRRHPGLVQASGEPGGRGQLPDDDQRGTSRAHRGPAGIPGKDATPGDPGRDGAEARAGGPEASAQAAQRRLEEEMKSILPRNARAVADVADGLVLASVEIEAPPE